jgi:hypothetical protein
LQTEHEPGAVPGPNLGRNVDLQAHGSTQCRGRRRRAVASRRDSR